MNVGTRCVNVGDVGNVGNVGDSDVITSLLARLDALGVVLTVVNGRLKARAPAGVLDDDLRAALSRHKTALMAHLPTLPTLPTSPTLTERVSAYDDATGADVADRVDAPIRIPLEDLADYLDDHGLRIVGGEPDLDSPPARWSPRIFLAEVGR